MVSHRSSKTCPLYQCSNFDADAVRTYELTWAIRQAAELSRAAKLQASAETAEAEKDRAS